MKTETKKLTNMGLFPARIWGHKASGISPTERLRIRSQVADMLGKKKQASLDNFSEFENMELEYKLAITATCYRSQVVLGRQVG